MVQSKELRFHKCFAFHFVDAWYPVISPNSIWNGRYVGLDLFLILNSKKKILIECTQSENM